MVEEYKEGKKRNSCVGFIVGLICANTHIHMGVMVSVENLKREGKGGVECSSSYLKEKKGKNKVNERR